jgi:hypothetical protein
MVVLSGRKSIAPMICLLLPSLLLTGAVPTMVVLEHSFDGKAFTHLANLELHKVKTKEEHYLSTVQSGIASYALHMRMRTMWAHQRRACREEG